MYLMQADITPLDDIEISQGCPLISVVAVEDFGLFIQPPYVLDSEPPRFLGVREQTDQANRKCVYTYHNHSLS